MYTGPNIVRDGLVFGYDTGYGVADNNATRFYPGEPTTNEFYGSGSNGNILDHSSGYGGYGTAQTGALDAFGTTENTVYRNTGKMRLGPTGGQDIGTLTNGNTYTFSIYLRHVPGENNVPGSNGFEFDIVDNAGGATYDFSGTLSSNMTYDWKRFAVTSTHSNNANYRFLDVGTYQGTNVWEWCMPQIEVGSHATPYTRTSRSSTVSLMDLEKTSNIDVSNVSFDSTGQPTFDGTDDYIDLGSDITYKTSGGWTVESVVYYNSVAGGYNNLTSPANFIGADGITYNSWYWSVLSNKLALWNISPGVWKYGSTTLQAGTWYHVVLVSYDSGTSYQMYLNGVAEGGDHTTYSWNASYSGLKVRYIGAGDSTRRYTNGAIPVTKIYNRALSPKEIFQNFRAYKNRFNI